MDDAMLARLKQTFREWSGGFPPDSSHEVTVFIDYAMESEFDAFEARVQLLEWMATGDPIGRSDSP